MSVYVVYVCAYVREKVMFEVYGGESESMSDQYGFFMFLAIYEAYCIFPYDSFYAGLSCSFTFNCMIWILFTFSCTFHCVTWILFTISFTIHCMTWILFTFSC